MILISIQVVITVVWLAVEEPGTRIIPTDNARELVCSYTPLIGLSLNLGYNLILLIVSTYFAFQTRKVPANFNEAKLINVTLYSICIIWLAFVPTYFATAETGTIFQTTTLVFGIIFSALSTLTCLFVSSVCMLFMRVHLTGLTTSAF